MLLILYMFDVTYSRLPDSRRTNLDCRASSPTVVTFSLELSCSASCSSEATELGGQLSPEVIDVAILLSVNSRVIS